MVVAKAAEIFDRHNPNFGSIRMSLQVAMSSGNGWRYYFKWHTYSKLTSDFQRRFRKSVSLTCERGTKSENFGEIFILIPIHGSQDINRFIQNII